MTAVPAGVDVASVRPAGVRPLGIVLGVVALAGALVAGISVGAANISPGKALLSALDHLPGLDLDAGLTASQDAIIWRIRVPRVVLGVLIGTMLSTAGASYQGAFRNPLADPSLLGVSAGAGLGATTAIIFDLQELGPVDAVPLFAFVGAMFGVALTYALASIGDSSRSPAVLLLAGLAVAAFLSAVQTFLLQRDIERVDDVYIWLLGQLATNGWHEVLTVLPYAAGTTVVLLLCARALDVLAVGDDEATTLGLEVSTVRLVVILTASLAVAAAVSVSGIIGFVAIVVPHTVRLLAGSSYRVILPLSILFGGAFLVLADLAARTVLSPAELPIGVITAFVGAPFFAIVLRSRKVVAV
jgi:iron complex transport system permease protein